MTETIYFKFSRYLTHHPHKEDISPEVPRGPVFHKWLPKGEQDGINLLSEENRFQLKVWFERCGLKGVVITPKKKLLSDLT